MTVQARLDELLELRHQARTLGLAAHHRVNSLLVGLYASVFRGQGMDFDEVREYREGDDIRNMDWRVTARTGVPHLKLYREERGRDVLLCVDVGPHMQFATRGAFKQVIAARAAALLGWAASDRNDRVGALLFGEHHQHLFRPTGSRHAMWAMLRALSGEDAHRSEFEGGLLAALERVNRGAPTGALIFVIGDFNRCRDALDMALGRLRQRHEVVLVPVDDPADWDLPAMGDVAFEDGNGQRILIDTDDERGRRAYTEQWQSRRSTLESRAFKLGVEVIPVRTDEDVHLALHRGLARRAMRRAVR
ncbi:MAG: DUF58 domain-containing protein [Gammaproteobacteria bacterium]|nr:DUF58 domain-containing protein [Gammaproteobacteria bacterium]